MVNFLSWRYLQQFAIDSMTHSCVRVLKNLFKMMMFHSYVMSCFLPAGMGGS